MHTLLWIAIGATEICVMLFIVAATVLAAVIRPATASPVMTYLYACDIFSTTDGSDMHVQPEVSLEVLDDMRVVVSRKGFGRTLTDTGAVSLAVNIKGTDISIEERITPGSGDVLEEPVKAIAYLDCLRPSGRPLHIHYRSQSLSREAAMSLAIVPGVVMTRILAQ